MYPVRLKIACSSSRALGKDHVARLGDAVRCSIRLRRRCRYCPSTSRECSITFPVPVTSGPSPASYHREHPWYQCQRAMVDLCRVVKGVWCVPHRSPSDWTPLKSVCFKGDLVYSRIFDQDVIIINSEKVAKALLEDRSSNYSGRPHLVTNEL